MGIERMRKYVVATFAILLIALPFLYVLSVGPAAWLVYHDWLSCQVYDAVY